jgi:hypothetical protein
MVTLQQIAQEWSNLRYGDVAEDGRNGYYLYCRKGHNVKKLGSYHIHLWFDGFNKTGVTLKNGNNNHTDLQFRGQTANDMAKNIYIDSGYNTNPQCTHGTRTKSKKLKSKSKKTKF